MKILPHTLFALILFQSCDYANLKSFTKEEKSFIEKSDLYKECEIFVDKDYEVIHNNSKNGHLYIRLDFAKSNCRICNLDSTKITDKIIPFAIGLKKNMDRRKDYDSLTIEASEMHRETKGMEYLSCGKLFDFELNNMTNFKYKEISINRKK